MQDSLYSHSGWQPFQVGAGSFTCIARSSIKFTGNTAECRGRCRPTPQCCRRCPCPISVVGAGLSRLSGWCCHPKPCLVRTRFALSGPALLGLRWLSLTSGGVPAPPVMPRLSVARLVVRFCFQRRRQSKRLVPSCAAYRPVRESMTLRPRTMRLRSLRRHLSQHLRPNYSRRNSRHFVGSPILAQLEMACLYNLGTN